MTKAPRLKNAKRRSSPAASLGMHPSRPAKPATTDWSKWAIAVAVISVAALVTATVIILLLGMAVTISVLVLFAIPIALILGLVVRLTLP